MSAPARRARRGRVVAGFGAVVLVAATVSLAPRSAASATGSAAPAAVFTVHADRVTGNVNRALAGFDWHEGGAPLSAVAPLHPAIVRIDASLEQVSEAPGVFDVSHLLERVAEVRAIGAEPLVILSYTPAWLARSTSLLGDRTKTPPRDLAAWQHLVHDVVEALATAPESARWFEAWNEPDMPIFWDGLPAAWFDTAAASARAVAHVRAETGLALRFGGPASVVPDPVYALGLAARLHAQHEQLGFVSWHFYGNLPCLAPDGAEAGLSTGALQRLLGCRNPLTTPVEYGAQIDVMRASTAAAALATGDPVPPLIIDEWNLSPGGLDARNDSVAGAAFDATVLMQMQRHGLDAAVFYAATDTDTRLGDYGTVHLDGSRKPSWWAFWLWQQLEPRLVAVDRAVALGPDVVASRSADGRTVTALVASFTPSCSGTSAVTVRFAGLRRGASATARRLGAGSTEPSAAPIEMRCGAAHLRIPTCSVTLLEVTS